MSSNIQQGAAVVGLACHAICEQHEHRALLPAGWSELCADPLRGIEWTHESTLY
jgi:hypothetical protein